MDEFKGLYARPYERVSNETAYPKTVVLHEKHIVRAPSPFAIMVDGAHMAFEHADAILDFVNAAGWQNISITRDRGITTPGWHSTLHRDGLVTVEVANEVEEKKALGIEEE